MGVLELPLPPPAAAGHGLVLGDPAWIRRVETERVEAVFNTTPKPPSCWRGGVVCFQLMGMSVAAHPSYRLPTANRTIHHRPRRCRALESCHCAVPSSL